MDKKKRKPFTGKLSVKMDQIICEDKHSEDETIPVVLVVFEEKGRTYEYALEIDRMVKFGEPIEIKAGTPDSVSVEKSEALNVNQMDPAATVTLIQDGKGYRYTVFIETIMDFEV